MPLNSSIIMVSVSSPEGLRIMMLRNNQYAALAPPADPSEDNKNRLHDLNNRFSSYLDKVEGLDEVNADLQDKINAILKKRKTPEGYDWDEAQKHLNHLEKEIKQHILENANQLLLINNNILANQDFKNKLDNESKARKEMEKDLDKMENQISNIKLEKDNLQTEISLVKNEINHLKHKHKDEVKHLLQQIKDFDVQVEVDSSKSNLADVIRSIRAHYQKLSEKNLKEIEDLYNDKFKNIEEAAQNEAFEERSTELKELVKEKKTLEDLIQHQYNTVSSLEETLNKTRWEKNQRLALSYRTITKLEANLWEVKSQVEKQVEINKERLTDKMNLEQEIMKYRELITAENERHAKP